MWNFAFEIHLLQLQDIIRRLPDTREQAGSASRADEPDPEAAD